MRLLQTMLLFMACFITTSVSAQEIKSTDKYHCESIFVGRFAGFKSDVNGTSGNGLVARYEAVHIISGDPCGRGEMYVSNRWTDKKNKRPKQWAFSKSSVPETGSWWIVFANFEPASGHWTLYAGPGESVKYSKDNLIGVLDGIDLSLFGHQPTIEFRQNLISEMENEVRGKSP